VRQDIKGNLARCYVAYDPEENPSLIGYYTLSSYALNKNDIPAKASVKFLPYRAAPITLLGRLAVDDRHQRKGFGKFLLMDALERSFYGGKTISSIGVLVEYKDQEARQFYLQYGFIEIPNTSRMLLPMKTISQLIAD